MTAPIPCECHGVDNCPARGPARTVARLMEDAATIGQLERGACTDTEDVARLRAIEHLVWHLLDDSERRGDEIVLTRSDDYEKLCQLLPEGHP